MLTLALDTSSAAGSAAVVRDATTIAVRAGDGSRMHGERLPRELMQIVEDAGVRLPDIDLLAVCIGPGSFTGLRVGIAAMQGLAFAGDRRIVPVSAFEAIAWSAAHEARAMGIWIDAHRGEVFGSLRSREGSVIAEPSSRPPNATLDAWAAHLDALAGPVVFMGDGAARYTDAIRARLGDRAIVDDSQPLLAAAIGHIASASPQRAVRPHAIAPLYVRRPDAELARDRRKFD